MVCANGGSRPPDPGILASETSGQAGEGGTGYRREHATDIRKIPSGEGKGLIQSQWLLGESWCAVGYALRGGGGRKGAPVGRTPSIGGRTRMTRLELYLRGSVFALMGKSVISTPVILNGGEDYKKNDPISIDMESFSLGFLLHRVQKQPIFSQERIS